jgi:hypothetical protein
MGFFDSACNAEMLGSLVIFLQRLQVEGKCAIHSDCLRRSMCSVAKRFASAVSGGIGTLLVVAAVMLRWPEVLKLGLLRARAY